MSIRDMHDRAMERASRADLARIIGDLESADSFLREAYSLERRAAESLKDRLDLEPTRSVLFRSAATLALDCGELREAERLAAMGLSGDAPEEIAEELREVFERATFDRHLDLHGYRLTEEEFQFSIAGDAVSAGVAEVKDVVPRIQYATSLVRRTAQRKLGYAFQEQVPSDVRKRVCVYLGAARAASLALSVRIAESKDQPSLPGLAFGAEVIDELLSCSELFSDGKIDDLRKRMDSEAYFINFVSLADRMAPDGERIRVVGLTAIRDGKRRSVNLTKPTQKHKDFTGTFVPSTEESAKEVELTGMLLFADASGRTDAIKIVDPSGKRTRIIVPEGLGEDVVRPLWNRQVVVTAKPKKRKYSLTDIREADE